jgi:serine/threonine protein kinase
MFEKKQKLGEGTSGIVRKCIRKSDQKAFAVKIVRTRDDEIIFHVSSNNFEIYSYA